MQFLKEKEEWLLYLGSTVEIIEKILIENKNNFNAQIANDNSEGSNCFKWKK